MSWYLVIGITFIFWGITAWFVNQEIQRTRGRAKKIVETIERIEKLLTENDSK